MLTGNYKFRFGLFGKLILQVEKELKHCDWQDLSEYKYLVWIDAKFDDLQELRLNHHSDITMRTK